MKKGGCIVLVLCLCVGIAAAGDWELRFTTNIGTNNDSQEYFVVGTDPYGWSTYNASIDVAAVPAVPGVWLEKKDGVPVISDYQRTINNIYPTQAVFLLNGTDVSGPVIFSFNGFASLPPIVGNVTVRYWNDSSTLVVQDIDEVNCTVIMEPAAFNTSVAPFLPNITAYYTSPPKPVPDFTANVTVGEMPLTVQFTNTSIGYGLQNPTWNFGDGPGYLFNQETPVHTYTLPGRYDVSLTIANEELATNTTTKVNFITVLAPAPMAAFSANLTPPSGNVPVLVNFTDASTANGGFAIASWYWEYGDGTNSTGQTPPDHLYSTEGTYLVNLTVTDTQVPAQSNTTTTTLTLRPPLPIPYFTATPTSGRMPVTIQFTDLSTGTNISGWAWDFNSDGSVDSTEQNPSWVPVGPFPAHYSVTLNVTDEIGQNQTTKANYLYINEADDGDSGPDFPPVTRTAPTPTVKPSDTTAPSGETTITILSGQGSDDSSGGDDEVVELPLSDVSPSPDAPSGTGTPTPTESPLGWVAVAGGLAMACAAVLRRR